MQFFINNICIYLNVQTHLRRTSDHYHERQRSENDVEILTHRNLVQIKTNLIEKSNENYT